MKLKIVYYLLAVTFLSCTGNGETMTRPENTTNSIAQNTSFYSFKVKSLEGEIIDFSKFKGKKVLVVNTASECGYTPQYKDLQKLHEVYGDKVAILGFPCNDFGGQEPGTSEDIKGFCEKNYGVTFQMFEKIKVKGNGIHPLYNWLTDKNLNGWNEKGPTWNFCKYLINEKGELIKYYSSSVKPMDKELIDEIVK
jgi:glutathione peroxidase